MTAIVTKLVTIANRMRMIKMDAVIFTSVGEKGRTNELKISMRQLEHVDQKFHILRYCLTSIPGLKLF